MPRVGLMGAIAAALVWCAPAHATDPFFSAITAEVGHVELYLGDVPGTQARFFEEVGERRRAVATATIGPENAVAIPRALTWSCVRRTRRLVAEVTHPDGDTGAATFDVRTPGCEERFGLDAPRSAAPGTRAAIVATDRWGLADVRPRLCVTGPAARPDCRTIRFGRGGRARARVRLRDPGTWRIALRFAGVVERRAVAVGKGAPPGRRPAPTLLVTGDSTVQGVDAALGDRVGGAYRVVRDFRVGTGLSQDRPRWTAIAERQAQRHRASVTVISVGANDGYPMPAADGTTAECCDAAWRAALAERARAVMRSLTRDGRGRLLWLTLPTPRDPRQARITAVINDVVTEVAPAVPGVTLVAVDEALSPGGQYRQEIRYRGRRRVVRADDGIHLSPAGAAIAAELVLRAL